MGELREWESGNGGFWRLFTSEGRDGEDVETYPVAPLCLRFSLKRSISTNECWLS